MALQTITTDGPWSLVGVLDTVPEWVGWVHRDAARWRDVVLETVGEGRRLGVEEPTGGNAKWALRYRLTLKLVHALGQLARALDLPMSCFAPWARRLLRADAGPEPWPGWGLVNWGLWRVAVVDAVRGVESHARDAANLRVELWHRVGLTLEGELVTPVPDNFGARQTSRGEDWNGRVCPSGQAATDVSWWDCIPLSVWWPGATSADRDVYVSATAPLKWTWDLAAGAADDIAELGNLERLVAFCRVWTAQKNAKAVAYMRTLPPVEGRQTIEVTAPGDLLAVAASDQLQNLQSVRVAGADFSAALRGIGDAIVTLPPWGTVIGAVFIGLAELLRAFGTAMGQWVDQWGRREPVLEVPRLTGGLSVTNPQAPTLEVARPPAALDVQVLEVTEDTNARLPGESLADWRRRVRADLAGERAPSLVGVSGAEELAAVQAAARAGRAGPSTRGRGGVLALAVVAAVALAASRSGKR